MTDRIHGPGDTAPKRQRCLVCGRPAETFRVCTPCSLSHDSTTGDPLARSRSPIPKRRGKTGRRRAAGGESDATDPDDETKFLGVKVPG